MNGRNGISYIQERIFAYTVTIYIYFAILFSIIYDLGAALILICGLAAHDT